MMPEQSKQRHVCSHEWRHQIFESGSITACSTKKLLQCLGSVVCACENATDGRCIGHAQENAAMKEFTRCVFEDAFQP